jgi:hypothetical protein
MRARNRIIVIGAAAALLLISYASPNHRADIRILAAEKGDANPHRMQAAIDLGVVAISVLITWTSQLTD